MTRNFLNTFSLCKTSLRPQPLDRKGCGVQMNENNKHHGKVMHVLVKPFYFYSKLTQQSRNGDSGKQEGEGEASIHSRVAGKSWRKQKNGVWMSEPVCQRAALCIHIPVKNTEPFIVKCSAKREAGRWLDVMGDGGSGGWLQEGWEPAWGEVWSRGESLSSACCLTTTDKTLSNTSLRWRVIQVVTSNLQPLSVPACVCKACSRLNII